METAQDVARDICDRFGRLPMGCRFCTFVGETESFTIEVGFFASASVTFNCPECGQEHHEFV